MDIEDALVAIHQCMINVRKDYPDEYRTQAFRALGSICDRFDVSLAIMTIAPEDPEGILTVKKVPQKIEEG